MINKIKHNKNKYKNIIVYIYLYIIYLMEKLWGNRLSHTLSVGVKMAILHLEGVLVINIKML